MKVAIVIPWFGETLTGGAEQLTWNLATRLAARGAAVTVLTTCNQAFAGNWNKNSLPAGTSETHGLTVKRFPVRARQTELFDAANGALLALKPADLIPGVCPVPNEVAADWRRENIHAPELCDYLEASYHDYDAFLFIPYLYGPILDGVARVAGKAYLQPCLHDECYAYLPSVEALFYQAKRLLFNSAGELALAAKLYGPFVFAKAIVVGGGIEAHEDLAAEDTTAQTGGNFVFYLGRRDATKNTDLLLRAYRAFRQKRPETELKLVLAGPGALPRDLCGAGVVDMGLVSEGQKLDLLKRARVLFQPSSNESLSRVMMEAWRQGTPVAVNRACLATAMAVEACNGGWLAGDEAEWCELFARMADLQDEERAEYGRAGQVYAAENADWDAVLDRYIELFTPAPSEAKVVRASGSGLKAIHQLLPNLSYGDAISNQALLLRDFFRELGYDSQIYVRYLDQKIWDQAQVFDPKQIPKDAGLVYHHSIGSEVTPFAAAFKGPKCLVYHNITPARFFEAYRPEFAGILAAGRRELAELGPLFKVSVGDSAYNADELRECGFQEPGVLPIVIDPAKWTTAPDPALTKRLSDGKTNLLFVGRIAPNKRQDDLLEAFAVYLTMDPNARLNIVGGAEADDPYYLHLLEKCGRLKLKGFVHFTGKVDEAAFAAYYRTAHLFWSMSEHEGFCVPLIEAMWFDVPVLAYKSSAVPETMADAGLLFNSKDRLDLVAATAVQIVKDAGLRGKLLRAQRKRRHAFLPASLQARITDLIEKLERGL